MASAAPIVPKPCTVPEGPVHLSWDGPKLVAQIGATDPFRDDDRVRLESGINLHLSLRVYSFAKPGSAPIAVGARACTIQYDLGTIEVVTVGNGYKWSNGATDLKSALRICVGHGMKVLNREVTEVAPTFVGVVIDIDPPDFDRIMARARKQDGYGSLEPGDALYRPYARVFCGDPLPRVAFRSGPVPP